MGRTGNKVLQRNKSHVCSFFVRGDCNRGLTCPYRHTDITDKDLECMKKGFGSVEDRIKQRYHGFSDPIATKILSRIEDKPKTPQAPADQTITTLFIGGVTPEVSQQDLQKQFSTFGKLV